MAKSVVFGGHIIGITINMRSTSLILTVLLIQLGCIHCSDIAQVESLYSDLFKDYNRKLFPLINHSDIVYVSASLAIISINTFDELTGEIELTLLFSMQWTDERLTWLPFKYGDKFSLLVEAEDLWRPRFSVIESFGSIQDLSNLSGLMRVYSSGVVEWQVFRVLKIYCSLDVQYFPFDTQRCGMTLSGFSYFQNELVIYVQDTYVELSFFSENSFWHIHSTKVTNSTDESSPVPSPSSIRFDLVLKRRSEFFIMYIIVPLVFLGFVNNIVFVMPVSSGERTSVAITAFLSVVVYMDMVNDNISKSSAPMAYIYYYITFLLVYSSMIIVLCTISLRIHDRKDNVPSILKKLTYFLRCSCLKRGGLTCLWLKRRRKISNVKQVKSSMLSVKSQDKSNENKDDEEEKDVTVTWTLVGNTFDLYCFIALAVTFWVMTYGFFRNLAYNNDFMQQISA